MSKEKILIIEDEEHIQELLTFNLNKEQYIVINLLDGTNALEIIAKEKPDLIILDLMLPGKDGIEICKEIRQNQELNYLPIIMLTAKSEEIDKVLGLEIGADDYITKPFSIKELIARIRANLRRTTINNNTENDIVIKVGDILIDKRGYEVFKNDKKINLTLKEFELLYLLATNRGKVLTRDYLLDKIWGYEYFEGTRTVDVHIRHLRKKLEEETTCLIDTIRGVGYRIIE
jgi:two-component system alkaline phosphatase synthesis response regulator PhoP